MTESSPKVPARSISESAGVRAGRRAEGRGSWEEGPSSRHAAELSGRRAAALSASRVRPTSPPASSGSDPAIPHRRKGSRRCKARIQGSMPRPLLSQRVREPASSNSKRALGRPRRTCNDGSRRWRASRRDSRKRRPPPRPSRRRRARGTRARTPARPPESRGGSIDLGARGEGISRGGPFGRRATIGVVVRQQPRARR